MKMEWQTVANKTKQRFAIVKNTKLKANNPPLPKTTHSKYSAVHVTTFFLLLIPHYTKELQG
jgi:hypothetical protein